MKYKKEVVTGAIVLLISLICTTKSIGTTAIVNTDTLKLRKEASTSSTVLELLNQGEKLEIIEQSGDWYKVKVNKITGFVHKDYIKVDEATETKTEEPKSENTTSSENTVQNEVTNSTVEKTNTSLNETVEDVNEAYNNTAKEEKSKTSIIGEQTLKTEANAYILPLINSSKIGNLKKDAKVTVLDEVEGWAYIQTDEIGAWIRTAAINIQEANAENTAGSGKADNEETTNNNEPQEQEIANKVMYVNSASIYVRKGPATTYEAVDTLILNNQVTVTAESGDWYKVSLANGTQGYIAKRLLSASKTETTSRGAEERTAEEEASNEEVANAQSEEASKGEQIAEYAKQFLGCKYVYGASGPSTFDCSGFTMYVYKNFGISLSHSARAQASNGTYVSKENLQPGDLVFFKDYETMDGIGHCGIYIGNGEFIHASSGTGYCVKISTLLSGSYNTRYETARRLI